MTEDENDGGGMSTPRGINDDAQKRLQVAQAALEDHWDDVISDLRATAEELEEQGWDTHWTRPGDVTITPDDAYGEDTAVFSVTVPTPAYEAAGEFVDGEYDVTGMEVYRAATNEAVFLVVVLMDEAAQQAFLYPMYYSLLEWTDVYGEGTVYTRIRNIKGDYWEFGHEDPELFAPPEAEQEDEEEEAGDQPGEPPEPPDPPEPPIEGASVEDLSELTPEELSELSQEELRAHRPAEFAELTEEQLAALDVPRGGGVDS